MSPIFYANGFLERAAELRGDTDWLADRCADPDSRVVPLRRDCNLVLPGEPPRALLLSATDLGPLDADHAIFLGIDADKRAYFAVEDAGEVSVTPAAAGAEFIDLRRLGPLMSAGDAGLLAYARAMAHWHRTHQFCGRCGCPTRSDQGGWVRRCDSDGCDQPHFPRTDAAIIVRVTHGEQILLGRQPGWPPRWYSVLAGFVEPGERLEDTVRREVREESGVRVGAVRYVASQPWPFPSSLMLGFTAEAEDTMIDLSNDELEDARWMTRESIREQVAAGELRLSPPQSISRRLIDEWMDESFDE